VDRGCSKLITFETRIQLFLVRIDIFLSFRYASSADDYRVSCVLYILMSVYYFNRMLLYSGTTTTSLDRLIWTVYTPGARCCWARNGVSSANYQANCRQLKAADNILW